jgi:hypothetical protein
MKFLISAGSSVRSIRLAASPSRSCMKTQIPTTSRPWSSSRFAISADQRRSSSLRVASRLKRVVNFTGTVGRTASTGSSKSSRSHSPRGALSTACGASRHADGVGRWRTSSHPAERCFRAVAVASGAALRAPALDECRCSRPSACEHSLLQRSAGAPRGAPARSGSLWPEIGSGAGGHHRDTAPRQCGEIRIAVVRWL